MQVIYNGRSNTMDFALELDNVVTNAPAALDAQNRLRLRLRDRLGVETIYDSQTQPDYFSITQRYVDGNLLRVFSIALGAAGLATGDYNAVLTMIDPAHTTGIVIHEFRASVRNS